MLKNDTLKNGTSRIGLYGSAPQTRGMKVKFKDKSRWPLNKDYYLLAVITIMKCGVDLKEK